MTTLGGGHSLPFAQIVIRKTSGAKVTTVLANAKGYAFVQRSSLPATFIAAVQGGKAWKRAGRPTLKATVSVPANNTQVVFISPVTGIASMVAAQKKIAYRKALHRTTRALQLPSWMQPWQYSTVQLAFSARRLSNWAQDHGNLGHALPTLARRIAKGQKVPNFSPLSDAKHRPSKTRSTVSWVGETVMDGILEGSASSGTEAAIGDMFGQSNPTANELSDIATELGTISTQLTVLQNSMNQLISIMEQAELTDLVTSMNTIMGNISDDWPVYQSAMSLDPTSPDYKATIFDYANEFYTDIAPFIGEFDTLFSSAGTNGVIAQLYANNDAPWWVASDVENIQSTIDYFGTNQAMAAALLNEAWWANGEGLIVPPTPEFINTENTVTYGPQNSNVYLSIPTSIDESSVVVPSQQMAYRLFGGKISYVQQKMNLVDGFGNCSNMGSPTNAGIWPYVLPSTTTWSDTWNAMITNSSFTASSSSNYALLSKPRTTTSTSGTTTTTYALPTLATGAPGAYVMVSAQSAPIASFWQFEDDSPILWAWLFCNNQSVSLDNVNSTTSWLYNFDIDFDGDNVPGGSETAYMQPIPVGVLSQQPGSYKYVPPAAG